jgi:hypothetical protein
MVDILTTARSYIGKHLSLVILKAVEKTVDRPGTLVPGDGECPVLCLREWCPE